MNAFSAASLISLLDEPKTELKIFALHQLNNIVDEFWHEISEVIEKLEILYEDKSFKQYKLAGLLVSKIYFHLGFFEDSLEYAINADELFDIDSRTEYVETILGKCIDCYTEQHCAFFDASAGANPPYTKLTNIINRLFRRCFNDGQYQHGLGLALEMRRLDVCEFAITQSNNIPDMLTYAFQVATNFIQHRAFKKKVLRLLVNLQLNLSVPDYISICQCLIFLDNPYQVTNILMKLIQNYQENDVLCYQMAFDLYESATQDFLENVIHGFPPVPQEENGLSDDEEEYQSKLEKLRNILLGIYPVKLYTHFLISSNNTDKAILNNTKENSRKIICYTGTVIANGFMQSGTTDDSFLLRHSQWLGKMKNWAKTTAVASLGVIHRGQIDNSIKILLSYVPPNFRQNASKYTKSGILYGLGLLHANLGGDIINFILYELKNAPTEEERHGACLGLGLAAMGTNREDLYEELQFELYQDEACTGEAAGIAMGMIMLGSNSSFAIEDMITYAKESQHEKILRGLSVGIALIMYGRLEEADAVIDRLATSDDAILRRSAMYAMAMAYCGTGNATTIKKFLHAAVSDVDNDVRRAAVIGLGFILFKTPEQLPNIMSMLIESFNPHVRYGAAMALGIACAGTGMIEAIALLLPIIESEDVNFVRQGALIASGMILMQQNEETCPEVKDFREVYADIISHRHSPEILKFGAILAQGIIDAGGRNVTISLQSRTGHTNMLAVVGTFLFTQYWYWFPLAHCLSLAFTPTCIIAVNSILEMPILQMKSDAKPSLFAYPQPLEANKEERVSRVSVTILSEAKRKASKLKITDQNVDVDKENKRPYCKTIIKRPDPTFEILYNPARVVKEQLPLMSISPSCRYAPVKDIAIGGIIVVKNLKPHEQEHYIEKVRRWNNLNFDPQPPTAFEWSED